jgi:hypothetical protein
VAVLHPFVDARVGEQELPIESRWALRNARVKTVKMLHPLVSTETAHWRYKEASIATLSQVSAELTFVLPIMNTPSFSEMPSTALRKKLRNLSVTRLSRSSNTK